MMQCARCGFLRNGVADVANCPDGKNHRFKAIELSEFASALGKAGGRPKVYATEAERRQARLNTFTKANEKRRQKKATATAEVA